jgi:hypothetical protein
MHLPPDVRLLKCPRILTKIPNMSKYTAVYWDRLVIFETEKEK